MAFTDNCDLYGAIHEDGINRIAKHITQQRPSLFNYGTAFVAANPHLLCKPIKVAPDVDNFSNPHITVEDPLPVLGTNGLIGLNFCFQITELEIDFHPGKVFPLPPELSPPLGAQHFAIHARVCGGIGCPPRDMDIPEIPQPDPTEKDEESIPPFVPPTKKLECFCLDMFVVGHIEMNGPVGDQRLLGKVDGLEIVDIEPDGLENSLECYLNLLLKTVILPRVSIAIPTMVFGILDLATITLSASTTVPNNPAIEDDQLKVFIDMGVSP